MEFRKIDGTKVVLEEYVREYLSSHPGIQLLVGCDSQNRGRETCYAVVVAMYTPGHGGHVIFRRWRTPKEYTRATRLLTEVWTSVEIAETLKNAGLPKVKWIDIDINPSPKYKSNEVFNQAVGLCEGMGYEVRYKTISGLVTTIADMFARK